MSMITLAFKKYLCIVWLERSPSSLKPVLALVFLALASLDASGSKLKLLLSSDTISYMSNLNLRILFTGATQLRCGAGLVMAFSLLSFFLSFIS